MGTYIVKSNDADLRYIFVNCKVKINDGYIYVIDNGIDLVLGAFNLDFFHIISE